MSYTIRDSLDVHFTKAPTIAIAGPSGSGKTESAMRLARGYCGPGKKFCVIDTEEKRSLYKKNRYQPWDWLDFQPPFSPENCREVLEVAKGYDAVVWDSGSSEYIGEGGLQDIADEALDRMCKGDLSRAEKLVMPSWKDAKRRHKLKLMSLITRYPTLLIICLRAEPKVKFIKVDGKQTIVDAGYQPLCEKLFMYEMLVACKMTSESAGVPEHVKQLEPDLEPVFLAGKQIDEGTGQRLAVWTELRKEMGATAPPKTERNEADYISEQQIADLNTMLKDGNIDVGRLLVKANVQRIADIKLADYDRAIKWTQGVIAAKAAAAA